MVNKGRHEFRSARRRRGRFIGLLLTLAFVNIVPRYALAAPCQRIVSLAPSITETLFALELGEQVVGVTRFCNYPPAAKNRQRVGGFLDPNLEAILRLRPDLVLLLTDHGELRERVAALGLETLVVNHRNISGILDSFKSIGERCDRGIVAAALRSDSERRMRIVDQGVRGRRQVRTLIAIGTSAGPAGVRGLFLSGRDGYYDELLRLAGGVNVNTSQTVQLPTVSAEGLAHLRPDVIIEVAAGFAAEDRPASQGRPALAGWQGLDFLPAVAQHRVYRIDEDLAAIPGPRFIELLERFAEILHS